jgi:predicted ATPase
MEPELYRLKGELLRLSGEPESRAEECFEQALTISRRRQYKSWELRAAMSLGRLWQQQGKRREARELLKEIHSWFKEGFDSPDWKEAQALLDELGET